MDDVARGGSGRLPDVTGPGPQTARRSLLAGALIGVGSAAFLDETVFHQLLTWHHFYDKSTPTVGLVSDSYFHAGGWAAVVVGLFLFADLQRRAATVPRRVSAGGLIGWGGFQVWRLSRPMTVGGPDWAAPAHKGWTRSS